MTQEREECILDFRAGFRETKRMLTLPMLRGDKVFLLVFCGLGLLLATIATMFGGYDLEKARIETEMLGLIITCLTLPILSLCLIIYYFAPRWSVFFRTQKTLSRCVLLMLDSVRASFLILAGGTVFYILSKGTVPLLIAVYYHLFMAEMLTKAAANTKDASPFKDYANPSKAMLKLIVRQINGGRIEKSSPAATFATSPHKSHTHSEESRLSRGRGGGGNEKRQSL